MSTKNRRSVNELTDLGSDAPFELIDGELVNWPPACLEASAIGARIGAALLVHVDDRNLGIVTGANGGYDLTRSGEPATVIAPSVGYAGFARIPDWFDFQGYFPGPPELAVVVDSPMRPAAVSARSIDCLLRSGAHLVWHVQPVARVVIVRRPDREPETLDLRHVLNGDGILPGFRLPVASIFREPGKRMR